MIAGTKCVCISLVGEIDVCQRQELDAILDVQDCPCVVILDVSGVTYLDSSALGAFIILRERVSTAGGGEVVLAGGDANVTRLMKITGLDQVFQAFGSVQAALRHFGGDDIAIEHRRFEADPA